MDIDKVIAKPPFQWKSGPKNAVQNENDRRWLAGIVRNAPPFSDLWVKARIVQLAYYNPGGAAPTEEICGLPVYQGLNAEQIADALTRNCSSAHYPYPEFCRRVNTAYVLKTLNAWKTYQFSQATSRNYDVYADLKHPNVFLVVSTAPVSLNVDRVLPPKNRYRPLFNVDELAQIILEKDINRVTLRTHGYANAAAGFYSHFADEADRLNSPMDSNEQMQLSPQHLYIGYHWPSENPITSPGLWVDYTKAPGVLLKFLFVLSGLAGIMGTVLYAFLNWLVVPILRAAGALPVVGEVWKQVRFAETVALATQWFWLVPTVFLLWLLVFLLLRIVVYQRDRYRAIHYGAPDLAEFFWRLDMALSTFCRNPNAINGESSVEMQSQRSTTSLELCNERIAVNMVGHSMGGLLLVNVLRILSERGHDHQGTLKPDANLSEAEDVVDCIGNNLSLDKLILASPDIPMEFLREGRNNYVRSAMRRCRRIYLMSSDRDIVLRYLSTVGNWFTEPSLQMAGERLGNVYLRPTKNPEEPFLPYIRVMVHAEAAVRPTSSYELFRKFNYLDCSRMKSLRGGGVNAVGLSLSRLTALPIDIINTAIYIAGAILNTVGVLPNSKTLDVHGGYFQVQTPTFRIFQFLVTCPFQDDGLIKSEIYNLIQGTNIRFLPSQSWTMPTEEPTTPLS